MGYTKSSSLFLVLGMEPCTSHMLGKFSTIPRKSNSKGKFIAMIIYIKKKGHLKILKLNNKPSTTKRRTNEFQNSQK
jgi:hypothetical protein